MEIEKLREERRKLLTEYYSVSGNDKLRQRVRDQIDKINKQLYTITGNPIYL